MGARELVAGRDCGACTACCITPSIDNAEIQKISGVRCRHCVANACDIYDTRPKVCRAFHCAWRYLPALGENWRPDRSGVLGAYDDARDADALTLTLTGNPLMTVRASWFLDFVRESARRGQILYLALPGPPGFLPGRILLNGPPLREAAMRSAGKVKEHLERALAFLRGHQHAPHVLKHSGNDAST